MRLRFDLTTATLLGLLLATTMGHSGGCSSGDEGVLGPLTETECPPTSTLSYDNFGRSFMESYCTECHSSVLTGAARRGAPDFHDFDTVAGVRAVANHVDQTAGIGPASANRNMPPDGKAQPSDAEREMLAEWIACGAPNTVSRPPAAE